MVIVPILVQNHYQQDLNWFFLSYEHPSPTLRVKPVELRIKKIIIFLYSYELLSTLHLVKI